MSDGAVQVHGVLVTYRRPEACRAALEALGRQTRRLDSLVVVDNAPSTEVQEFVDASDAAKVMHYIASATNSGPAGGIAQGMMKCLTYADADDFVCVLDDDDPVDDPGILGATLRFALTTDADVAGVGSGGAVFDWSSGRLRPALPGAEVDYLKSDRCPLYRIRALQSVGVFAERLFFGFDDLEFGLRLHRSAWRLLVVPNAPVPANFAAPSWRVSDAGWRRYYSLRNLIYVLRTDGHRLTALRVSVIVGFVKPLVNLPRAPRLSLRSLGLNARAVLDGWSGRLGLVVVPDSGRRPGK
jgi:glycosyltransferase involved in cell wall biosynthesis